MVFSTKRGKGTDTSLSALFGRLPYPPRQIKLRFKAGDKTLEKSFAGGILGHWSVWTHKAVEVFEKIKRGENPQALLTLANEITDANAAFFDAANGFKGCIASLHEGLRQSGPFGGHLVPGPEGNPVGRADGRNRPDYTMYPHLNDDAFVKGNLAKWLA